MGLNAFFRLACRPAIVLMLASAATFAMLVLIGDALLLWMRGSDPDYDSNPEQLAHLMNMSAVVLPLLGGLLSADLAYDVRMRSFAWMLPRLEAKLLRSVVLVALVSATGTVVAHAAGGGEGDLVAVFGFALFVFAVGHHLLDRPVRREVVRTGWLSAIAALILADPLMRVVSALPLLTLAAGVAALAFLLRAAYSRSNSRGIVALEKMLTLINVFNPIELERYHLEVVRSKEGGSDARWLGGRLAGDVRTWVKAAIFETCGNRTIGRLWLEVMLAPMVLACIVVAVGFQDGYEIHGRVADGWTYAWHALMIPGTNPGVATHNNAPVVIVSMMVGVWVGQTNLTGTPLLTLGRAYPITRADRARLAWRSSLRNTLVVASTALVGFGAVAAVVGLLAEPGPAPLRLPGFARAILASIVLAPFVQWVRVRYVSADGKPRFAWVYVFVAVIVLKILILTVWVKEQSDALGHAPLLELGLFFLLAVGSYSALRPAVAQHYARADLV